MKEGKELEIFCFLCKKQNTKSTINRSYSDDNNSVKENLMELYGDAVEHYLSDDVPVCLNCSQILDNTVRLKRQLYEVIVDNAVNMEVHGKPGSKSFDFMNIWMRVTSSTPTDERYVSITSGSRYRSETPFLDREVQRINARSQRIRRKLSN